MFTTWYKAKGVKRAEGRKGEKRKRKSLKIETRGKIPEIVQIYQQSQ